MEFYDVVAQVIELLEREGRVSYRALKAQFQIDDDLLDVLKEEIIEVHQLGQGEGEGLLAVKRSCGVMQLLKVVPRDIRGSQYGCLERSR